MTTVEAGKKLGLSQPAVSIEVARGETMVRDKGFVLPKGGTINM